MKRLLTIMVLAVVTLGMQAQDFVTKYREICQNDTCLHYVCVSPKMMEQVLEAQIPNREQAVHEVLKHLKSMQVISCGKKPGHYYTLAQEVLNRNTNRFVPFTSYEKGQEKLGVSIRKKKNRVTELVLIRKTSHNFVAINFTGNLPEDLFLQITKQLTPALEQNKEPQ